MKITANRKALLAAFGAVNGVAPPRSPKVILQSLKLEVTDDSVTLLASDLEVAIRYTVSGVRVDRPGSAILNPAKFGPILSTSVDDELSIEVDGDTVQVRGVRAKFNLPSEDPALFPDVPEWDDAYGYSYLHAIDFERFVKRTMFATDAESTRYALGGVLFEIEDGQFSMVGTDGRRLAKQSGEVFGDAEFDESVKQPVVPLKALKLLDRLCGKTGEADFQLKTNTATFRVGGATVWCRLVEGRFPRYQDVFPKSCEARIPIEVGPLRNAVEQASILTSDESRGVDFDFTSSLLTLASKAADVGSSSVELPIGYEGAEIGITFDPRYLADALKNLDDATTITAELIDHKNAAVFKTDDGYSYVVMPLTRDR